MNLQTRLVQSDDSNHSSRLEPMLVRLPPTLAEQLRQLAQLAVETEPLAGQNPRHLSHEHRQLGALFSEDEFCLRCPGLFPLCQEGSIVAAAGELAVEAALSAPALVPGCRMPRSLQGFMKRNI